MIQYGDRTTWPLLAIPIVAAAIRHRLPAALFVWAVTAAYAGVIVALGSRAGHPEDVTFALCMHLLIALVTGSQLSAFGRQLADLQATPSALQHEAAHDALTGLPNRVELTRYAGSHEGEALAVLLLDLNAFKPVNDTYGHGVGDDVLRTVGERLTACLRDDDDRTPRRRRIPHPATAYRCKHRAPARRADPSRHWRTDDRAGPHPSGEREHRRRRPPGRPARRST